MRILPSAMMGDRTRYTDDAFEARARPCIKSDPNGAVYLCLPTCTSGMTMLATEKAPIELYLRYLGVPIDIYTLSLIENPTLETGYTADQKQEAAIYNRDHREPQYSLTRMASQYSVEFEEITRSTTILPGEKMPISSIANYIDQGIPILSSLLPYISSQAPELNPDSETANGLLYSSHFCLIVGYNEKSGEVACLCANVRHRPGMDYGPR